MEGPLRGPPGLDPQGPGPRDPGRDHPQHSTPQRTPSHQVDVCVQADLRGAEPLSYESEDEGMGRRTGSGTGCSGGGGGGARRSRRPLHGGGAHYSKQDIREQYCITDKQLIGLERRGNQGIFGCLSYENSPCGSSRSSLLSVCMRRKVPSDENLHEAAPLPRWSRYASAAAREDLAAPGTLRRRPRSVCAAPQGGPPGGPDPKRYTWTAEDEDATPRMVSAPRYSLPCLALSPGTSVLSPNLPLAAAASAQQRDLSRDEL
ncbi:uncharacterized protein LOC127749126 [Frankliniella occidentalis]|uniref:Uncharacterized protein LOC127749126 n=1 Tax=Frankliniella occidentalis TaxID=133901 RepID=A0A9C6U5B1_FRAOC|nr:uncharacterized protein LOC127749126 [Frankliniella occidentalis]